MRANLQASSGRGRTAPDPCLATAMCLLPPPPPPTHAHPKANTHAHARTHLHAQTIRHACTNHRTHTHAYTPRTHTPTPTPLPHRHRNSPPCPPLPLAAQSTSLVARPTCPPSSPWWTAAPRASEAMRASSCPASRPASSARCGSSRHRWGGRGFAGWQAPAAGSGACWRLRGPAACVRAACGLVELRATSRRVGRSRGRGTPRRASCMPVNLRVRPAIGEWMATAGAGGSALDCCTACPSQSTRVVRMCVRARVRVQLHSWAAACLGPGLWLECCSGSPPAAAAVTASRRDRDGDDPPALWPLLRPRRPSSRCAH